MIALRRLVHSANLAREQLARERREEEALKRELANHLPVTEGDLRSQTAKRSIIYAVGVYSGWSSAELEERAGTYNVD